MKKRSLAILAGGMSLALLLSSCGPSSAPTESPSSAPADETGQQTAEEPVTITYCNFNASGGNEETLQKMYEAFHEEHPNITVEIETIAMDDYFTQMQTRVAGGTAPDCYELNIENFASYANKGVLAEISGVDLSRLDETALSAFNVDGKQYGLPGNFSNVVLVYNKDLFDQAGIDYPTNSPENVAAAQMMADRVLVSNVQPTDVQMGGMGDWDLFMSGRLGMIPTGIWAFQSFADGCDFNWDITIEPGQEQKATHFFSNGLVINADSEHKDAAATWITWLASSPAAAEIRIEAGWDLPAVSDEDTLASYLDMTPPDNRQAVFDSLDYLVVPPVIEDYALMSDIIGQKLSAAANGSITVQEALDQAQSECEAQISLS